MNSLLPELVFKGALLQAMVADPTDPTDPCRNRGNRGNRGNRILNGNLPSEHGSNLAPKFCRHRNNPVEPPGFSDPNPTPRPVDTDTDIETDIELELSLPPSISDCIGGAVENARCSCILRMDSLVCLFSQCVAAGAPQGIFRGGVDSRRRSRILQRSSAKRWSDQSDRYHCIRRGLLRAMVPI